MRDSTAAALSDAEISDLAASGALAPSARTRIHVPLWLLALITFSGTLAMHIFVPALPIAAEGLNASAASMQLTVSLYIVGLAFGQLVYGPLADRFGRRPTLMIGLALYTVSGFAAAVSPTVGALIVARLFQALGGCAGLVLARTVVRDTSEFEDAARRLALMNLMVTIGPGVSPIVGGALATAFGWRSIFYGLTLFGLFNLLLAWKMLPETRIASGAGSSDIKVLARNYGSLLKSRVFLGYSIGGGCATTSMYAFVAAAPFIFVKQLHREAHEVGFYLAMLIFGVTIGSFIATRLIRKVPMRRLLVCANGASVAAAVVLLGAAAEHVLSVPLVVATMFVFTMGVGIASPAALTEAISVNPAVTGSASGLYGFIQMAVGAICTALVGLGDDPALAAGLVLVGSGIISQSAFFMASRQARQVRP